MPADTPARFAVAVRRAVDVLRAGEVVALPTETVYGLAANALDPVAVRKIFETKGRPAANPVIVHVASIAMARQCVSRWPDSASKLAAAFWPGPLTVVLPRSPEIPDEVTAGGETVGVRWPAHPLIQAVIVRCGFPLAAPSANRANETSPTLAAHVVASLGDKIPLIIDGGASQVGIESTVLDLTSDPPRVLRPGIIHEESLAAALGEVRLEDSSGPILRSPGLFPRHYAPRGGLRVLTWNTDAGLREQLRGLGSPLEKIHVLAHEHIPSGSDLGRVCVIPHDPEAYARAMYAEWHRADALGAEWIVVESVPTTPAWSAIADRLRRASG
jgi:L-threonylcarbamoyladenylate synthase